MTKRFCFNKSYVVLALIILFLLIFTSWLAQLPYKKSSTNTRAYEVKGKYLPTLKDINIGTKKVAIILSSFDKHLASEEQTPELIKSIFDTKINPFYLENSFNKLSMAAKIYGWYRLPIQSPCDTAIIIKEMLKVADKDINYQEYDTIVFLYPYLSCAGGGGAFVLNNQTEDGLVTKRGVILSSDFYVDMTESMIHELGHTLGAWHSNGWDCGSKSIDWSDKCTNKEYMNNFDIMGDTKLIGATNVLSHFGGYFKKLFGWIPDTNIKTVTKSGIYTISPIETQDKSIQLLIIPIPNSKASYYIENREKIGLDSESYGVKIPGAIINIAPNINTQSTELIDTTPETDSFTDSMLIPGNSYSDPNGLIIKTISDVGGALTVSITLPQRISVASIKQFSDVKAIFTENTASFYFSYPASFPFSEAGNYIIDMSVQPDMKEGVYGTFASGDKSPIIEKNPIKWDKYSCGRKLYWRIFTTDRSVQSPIQNTTIYCTRNR